MMNVWLGLGWCSVFPWYSEGVGILMYRDEFVWARLSDKPLLRLLAIRSHRYGGVK